MIWLYQTVRIEHLNQQEIDNILAKMGKDKPVGWELVTIYNGLAYFKKPDIRAMKRREGLLAQVNESQQAYETGQIRRGTAADLIADLVEQEPDSSERFLVWVKKPEKLLLEDFEANVLRVIRKHMGNI